MSLFGMLEMSKRALIANQTSVRLTNHNIANMGTPGYVRQRPNFVTMSSVDSVFGRLGSGVELQSIQRVTDDFLAASLRGETTEYSEWLEANDVLSRIESIVDIDDETSLSATITEFFNAYGDLAENVEDGALRQIVVNKAEAMTRRFQTLSRSVTDLRDQVNDKVSSQVRQVNSILSRVAEINDQIVGAEAGAQTANDLRTAREQLLSELAQFVDIQTREGEFGEVDVFINGRNMVHRAVYQELELREAIGSQGPEMTVGINGDGLAADDLGGSLGALMDTRDKELNSVLDAVNTLAASVIDRVNGVSTTGQSIRGVGIEFFEGSDAGDIRVHNLLLKDADYITTSYNGTFGDNSAANDIANLVNTMQSELGDKSFVGYYANLVGAIGSVSENASLMVESKRLSTDQLRARLESVAGVSLDEELANLIRFQTAYEAAASVVNTVTEMIDTVLLLGVR